MCCLQLFAVVPLDALGYQPYPGNANCNADYMPFHNGNFQVTVLPLCPLPSLQPAPLPHSRLPPSPLSFQREKRALYILVVHSIPNVCGVACDTYARSARP